MSKQQTLGQRVNLLRTSLKLNAQQFAADVDLTVTSVYRIEKDQSYPHAKTIAHIASVYGVSVDWINEGLGELKFTSIKKHIASGQQDPWKEAAFTALTEERDRLLKDIEFYKELIREKSHGKSNFLKVVKSAANS